MVKNCAEITNLKSEYRLGHISMREVIEHLDLGPDATYEDYCEALEEILES